MVAPVPSPLASTAPGPAHPPSAPPPPAYYGGRPLGGRTGPSPETRERDVGALRWVRLAAILALVAGVAGIAANWIFNALSFLTVTSTTSGSVVSVGPLVSLEAYLAVVLVLAVTELALLRAGFWLLSGVDESFSTPSSLAIVAMAGMVMVVLGVVVFLDALVRAVECSGAGNPLSSACLGNGEFLGSIALLGIGAIVALVGYIGVLIGLWRLGTRYNDSMFKVGAILLIFPFLNLVGAILILIGANAALRQAEGATTFAPAGSF